VHGWSDVSCTELALCAPRLAGPTVPGTSGKNPIAVLILLGHDHRRRRTARDRDARPDRGEQPNPGKLLSCALSLHSAPIGMPDPEDQDAFPHELDVPSWMAQPEVTVLARASSSRLCVRG
jgi:hypothetical protein